MDNHVQADAVRQELDETRYPAYLARGRAVKHTALKESGPCE
ncbi:hypothetical protein Skr01_71940 [Sphaerisporangium krabiense]|nr:hypothetical protein Skr01_71940 [Sphaerisporangium krabiense]